MEVVEIGSCMQHFSLPVWAYHCAFTVAVVAVVLVGSCSKAVLARIVNILFNFNSTKPASKFKED